MGSDLDDWVECCVEDIAAPTKHSMCTGPFGSAISSKFFQEEGVPIIRGRNLSAAISEKIVDERWVYVTPEKASQHQRSLVRDGDLVFTCWGTIDQVGLIDSSAPYSEFILSNKQMKLTPDTTKATSLFLYYFFSNPITQARIVRNDIGSTIPGFNLGQLKVFEIRLPPLIEQKEIARILKSLDDKIELNRRMNETLEGMAQALFKSWFVDFDPVIDNALAAGNPIPAELADRAEVRRAALADGTANREAAKPFPAAFQQTEQLGWIPEGWELAEITKIADLNSESWSKKNHPSHVSYIDLGNAKNGRISEVTAYEFSEAPSRARRVLKEDDTIIGTVRPGNRSFAYIHEAGLTGSTGFAALTPKATEARTFVYLCLTQDETIDYFAHLADGGAYPAIRPDVVGSYLTPICTPELMVTFDKCCYPMFEKIGESQRQNLSLTKLRDTLLPKLISGELRIPDAEKLAAEALA